jgi:DNA-directed RNA polymerase subunit RPC12/RpoP
MEEYKCAMCARTFNKKEKLESHKKDMHSKSSSCCQ